jgi:hypothetical protein
MTASTPPLAPRGPGAGGGCELTLYWQEQVWHTFVQCDDASCVTRHAVTTSHLEDHSANYVDTIIRRARRGVAAARPDAVQPERRARRRRLQPLP